MMYQNSINESIDIISYLVDKTNWGKNATSKVMLQLVYDEFRELGASISNIDIENVIEEVSDINMMLGYFCCKLPNMDINDIKELFFDSVNEANKTINCTPNTKELYLMALKNYSRLTNAYEDKESNLLAIHDSVKAVSVPTLSLASLMNGNKLSTLDTVFTTISTKLQRRYSSYFDHNNVIIPSEYSEEELWHIGKQLEKDIPFNYCNNKSCRNYRKLGSTSIQISQGQLVCTSCGKNIQENSILLSKKQSSERRHIFEEFEKNLISYYKGDKLIASIYIFNNIEDCINIISDLICNDLPLDEFIFYYSSKFAISRETVEEFLLKCFASIFLFNSNDSKIRNRAKAMRRFINSSPMGFIETATVLGFGKMDISRMLFLSLDYLAVEYDREMCWEHINHEVKVDLRRKQAFFSVLFTIRKVLDSERNVTTIILSNLRKELQGPQYIDMIRYFFLDKKYCVKNINIGDADDKKS